jgi:hypothetical protein
MVPLFVGEIAIVTWSFSCHRITLFRVVKLKKTEYGTPPRIPTFITSNCIGAFKPRSAFKPKREIQLLPSADFKIRQPTRKSHKNLQPSPCLLGVLSTPKWRRCLFVAGCLKSCNAGSTNHKIRLCLYRDVHTGLIEFMWCVTNRWKRP